MSEKKTYQYTIVSDKQKTAFEEGENTSDGDNNGGVPKMGSRHLQVLLYIILVLITFGFRICMSVSIVAMTNPATSRNPGIPTYPEWKNKNLILSAFFLGYMCPQIFAGWVAKKFGAKWSLIITSIIEALLGILIPSVAEHFGSTGLIIVRAVQGFCQGFVLPSLTHLLGQWIPAEERSIIGAVVYGSNSCGTLLSMLLTGWISAGWYGWPMVFYLYGTLGLVWCIAMTFLGYDSPAVHPNISEAERKYIQRSLGHYKKNNKAQSTPWKSMFSSLPLWALFITQSGNNYFFGFLQTEIPSYMHSVMQFNIKDNSVLSSLPYLFYWLLSFPVGFISDTLVNKGILSRTGTRKLFNIIGVGVPAAALGIFSFTRSDQPIQAEILLIVAVGLNAAVLAGWNVNHMDLSPNHAGTLMGVCNGFSMVMVTIAPVTVHFMVHDEADPLEWRGAFLLAAGIAILATCFYLIFGSGETQPWNDDPDEEEMQENEHEMLAADIIFEKGKMF